MEFAGETIWIIGCSSGIGKALALELNKRGAKLILSSRRKSELVKLQLELGEKHHILPLDVSNLDEVEAAGAILKQQYKTLDRTIFMAAVYEPTNIQDIDLSFTKKLIEINLLGAIYIANAALNLRSKEKKSQVIFCGSVAGYTGLPSGQPYSATKAAIINFAESLYAEADNNLDVKLINPGFVRTPATDKNNYKMPMRIEPEEAAIAIADGLNRKAFEIHFPKRFTRLMKLLASLPYALKLMLTKHF